MKKIYMRDYSSNNFDKIVDYVLYASDYGNEEIIDDMVYWELPSLRRDKARLTQI